MSAYKAELFYGYQITIPNKDKEKIEELAEATELSITYTPDNPNEAILGKKLQSTEEDNIQHITPETFLKSIRSIKLGSKLKKLESKLNVEDVEPKLVLCTLNYDK